MNNKGDPNYNHERVSKHFDEYGNKEWNRLIENPIDEVNLYIHTHYLEKYIKKNMRILEVGAGAGRFTQILAGLGAKIVVADISEIQLNLNKKYADQFGFSYAVKNWIQVDICNMKQFESESFDCIVAYGGPLSYVLDKRDDALKECIRILKNKSLLYLSVMSMWGTIHRSLNGIFNINPEINKKIISSGDISKETYPERKGNYMHLFRAKELRDWLINNGLNILDISASNGLSLCWDEFIKSIRNDEKKWNELLSMELEACADEGSLNMGTHMIAVVSKP